MRELGEKAEIDYTFPYEHVLAPSYDLIPWFADFANIWLVIQSHRTCPSIRGKSSCIMQKSSFGMSLNYNEDVLMGLIIVMCQKWRC